MAKSDNGLGGFDLKPKAKTIKAKQKPVPTQATVKREVITYRINPGDKQLLTIYAATNGTKIQELLNQALRLLAVERDIPLSDEIMQK